MTSQVARDDSHRFITDNLSNMTLAPAGTQTVTLSYDEIFPLTDAAVCTEVHPVSAGGCADGVCCKVSISMYTITDAIIMTSRVNNRKADGNPQFWKCEQEFQVPGVTNTEPTGEEIAAEILHGEDPPADGDIGGSCGEEVDGVVQGCGTYAECIDYECECEEGYVPADDGKHCQECDEAVPDQCEDYYDDINTECKKEPEPCPGSDTCPFLCSCKTGYYDDGTVCADINECTTTVAAYKHKCDTEEGATCDNDIPGPGSYTCACNSDSESDYYGDGFLTTATNPNTEVVGTGCTVCEFCTTSSYYCEYPGTPTTATANCCKIGGCRPKKYWGETCTDNDGNPDNDQCNSNNCNCVTGSKGTTCTCT